MHLILNIECFSYFVNVNDAGMPANAYYLYLLQI